MTLTVDPPGQLVAVAALKAAFAAHTITAHVATQKPGDPTQHPQFVVLSRIGGGRSNFATSSPRLLVECYATKELDAERLANTATAAFAWAAGRTFSGHTLRWWADDNNIVRFDDPNVNHTRFQFTGTLSIALS
ncbi:hypothetical protein QT969_10450 [Rhodococcus sp. CSLK01-03]|uniref:Tail terminator n=1 Tax=Rhodococcus indonesiensis TaxID=3055869 RepID=A0ABT7RNW3_9NOCA|nr:hypothetical protein [Rhodococcus indonesiensis]MDM7488711.1 hypothetical protein [Rhodococcus indonesiensis]